MWQATLLRSICVVITWVGIWGLTELFVDHVSKDNTKLRAITYTILLALGIFLLWLLDFEI
jgi:hypothetical protein